jgi:hypothetical protein
MRQCEVPHASFVLCRVSRDSDLTASYRGIRLFIHDMSKKEILYSRYNVLQHSEDAHRGIIIRFGDVALDTSTAWYNYRLHAAGILAPQPSSRHAYQPPALSSQEPDTGATTTAHLTAKKKLLHTTVNACHHLQSILASRLLLLDAR